MKIKTFIFSLFSIWLVSQIQIVESTKCRALILGGGGSKGSYQAGGIYGLINATLSLAQQKKKFWNEKTQQFEQVTAEDIQWDVLSGVSAGSLNAAMFFLYEKGQEMAAMNTILDLWDNIVDDQVFKYWNSLLIDGLWEPGLLNTDPLRETLYKKISPFQGQPMKRMANIATVNLNTGEYVRLTDKNFITSTDGLLNATLCSSAIPAVFPPRICNNELYIDGGSIWNYDMIGAIERCKEITDDESQIIIDVVLCSPESYTQETTNDINSWKTLHMFYIRDKFPNTYYTQKEEVQKTHPLVQFRYYVAPAKDLAGELIPLNFDPDLDKKNINQGYQDGFNEVLSYLNKKN